MRALIITLSLLLPVQLAAEESISERMDRAWWESPLTAGAEIHRDLAEADAAFLQSMAGRALDDPETLEQLSDYAYFILARGQHKQARTLAGVALELAKTRYGDQSIELVPYLFLLADTDSRQHFELPWLNDSRIPLITYRRALNIIEKHYGRNSVEYAEHALFAGASVLRWKGSTAAIGRVNYAHDYFAARKTEHPRLYARATIAYARIMLRKRRGSAAASLLIPFIDEFDLGSEFATSARQDARELLVPILINNRDVELATKYCVDYGREAPPNADFAHNILYATRPSISSKNRKKYRNAFVDLEFSVDEHGFVVGPRVVDSSERQKGNSPGVENSPIERAALLALRRFRYAPKFEDGQPVRKDGVSIRFNFR